MASHSSSGCETDSSRQADTPKLEKRLSTVDNLVDEIVVAGIESALRGEQLYLFDSRTNDRLVFL